MFSEEFTSINNMEEKNNLLFFIPFRTNSDLVEERISISVDCIFLSASHVVIGIFLAFSFNVITEGGLKNDSSKVDTFDLSMVLSSSGYCLRSCLTKARNSKEFDQTISSKSEHIEKTSCTSQSRRYFISIE